MRILLLGTGGATPYKQRTTPMTLVETPSGGIMVDCGSGACLRLAQAGVRAANIEALFFSHFHADHCVDLPLVVLTSYLQGRTEPFRIYGPKGVHEIVNMYFETMFNYVFRLVKNVMGTVVDLRVKEISPDEKLQLSTCVVQTAEAQHGVPALAYRIDLNGKSVVLSGDTEPSEHVTRLATGCDVLLHDCSFPDSIGVAPGHSLPSQVSQVAAKAKPKCLVLYHLFEETIGAEQDILKVIQKSYHGTVVFGQDLTEVSVGTEVVFRAIQ